MEYTTCTTWRSHKADMEKFRTIPGMIITFTNSLSLNLSLNFVCLFGYLEFYEAIHESNIISSEMLRLVQNLNFYIMFEVFRREKKNVFFKSLNKDLKYYLLKKVLEVSWKKLEERLESAKDMDDVIEANETFLDTIISQLLLDQNSTVTKT